MVDAVGNLEGSVREATVARAAAYPSLWDPESKFFRPRNADGSFKEPFDPLVFDTAYVEGNAWQYLWMPLWDAPSLAAAMGSEDALIETLSTFFAYSAAQEDSWAPDVYYWHGNEPNIHAAFLFALAGNRGLTAMWTRWIEDNKYALGAAGLDGNDDAGTLGAWYLWSAAGLYPIAGTLTYVLSEPRFDAVRLGQGAGAISLARVPQTTELPQGISLNGTPWSVPTVTWLEIRAGAELRFVAP